jgi:predicted DNA-binding protein with PD1-like motif
MKYQTGAISKIHVVRMANDEDILHGLEAFTKEAGIKHASILSAVGSIKAYHSHVVHTTNLPPGNDFTKGIGPFDIITMTGGILNGRVHAHIEYSDRHCSHGGHLEEGTIVLTFAIITIAELDGIDLTDHDRYPVPERS